MFRNCYLHFGDSQNMQYSAFETCIVWYDSRYSLPNSAIAINSVSLSLSYNYGSAFRDVSYNENCAYHGYSTDLATVFSDQANFILQEEFAKKYLGTDGKEVGMFGGIGYTTKVRYPIISTLSIGNGQTTSREGKLDVTIELDRE